jgi:two-component system nitrogen regulation sensor histidine kinase GlnL
MDVYNIIDSIGEGVIILDNNYNIIQFNPVAEKITMLSKKKAIGKSFKEIFKSNEKLIEILQRSLNAGEIFLNFENNFIRADRSIIPLSITISPLEEKEGIAITMRDISLIKNLEEELRLKDRLASFGTIALGISHEIKNPLGGIMGSAELLRKEFGKNEYIDIIIKEVERIDSLMDNLLSLADQKKLNITSLNIHKVLDDVINMFKTKDVIFERIYDPSLPEILGDEDRLIQVFLNIIKNGIESMDGMGIISIITRVDYQVGKRKMVSIEIRDNGTGIKKEDIDKLFTPFFTTKPKGTGLGLTISHKIISEHKGSIRVESKFGEGTKFSINLPLAEHKYA